MFKCRFSCAFVCVCKYLWANEWTQSHDICKYAVLDLKFVTIQNLTTRIWHVYSVECIMEFLCFSREFCLIKWFYCENLQKLWWKKPFVLVFFLLFWNDSNWISFWHHKFVTNFKTPVQFSTFVCRRIFFSLKSANSAQLKQHVWMSKGCCFCLTHWCSTNWICTILYETEWNVRQRYFLFFFITFQCS